MTVFGNYSRYYDLLYRDKDYGGEAAFVLSLVSQHRPDAHSLLDLGCGTGKHAKLFAAAGYDVMGVDRSEEMLEEARRVNPSQANASGKLEFGTGDVRSVRLERKFDVVTSLFHVMSYQTSNTDLSQALATIRTHLAPGGLFIFDCWYGPAVLNLRPSVRVLRLEDPQISVTRIAEPKLHPNQNVVDVNYHIFVKDKQSAAVSELRETHSMRYLFVPEVEAHLAQQGLRLTESRAFMSNDKLGQDTWTAVFIGEATQ